MSVFYVTTNSKVLHISNKISCILSNVLFDFVSSLSTVIISVKFFSLAVQQDDELQLLLRQHPLDKSFESAACQNISSRKGFGQKVDFFKVQS